MNVIDILSLRGTPMEGIDISDALNPETNDEYEYIGDAVFHMIITDIILNLKVSSHEMTQIRIKMESNVSMNCMMKLKGLCSNRGLKSCADVFEAIIGLLYVRLRESTYSSQSIDILRRWLNTVWNLDSLVYQVYNTNGSVCDLLSVDKCESCTATWTRCDTDGYQYLLDSEDNILQTYKCPEQLYATNTYAEPTCIGNMRRIIRPCKNDISLCGDRVERYIPCKEGGAQFMPVPNFRKHTPEEMIEILRGEIEYLKQQGISPKVLAPFERQIQLPNSKSKLIQMHIDLFNLSNT